MKFQFKTEVLASLVTASLLFATVAEAHVQVRSVSPRSGATVNRKLNVVRVTFTGPLRSGRLTVVGAGNRVVSVGRGGRDPRAVNRILVPLRSGLRPGRYRASWTVVAADGHRQLGSFRFRLR